MLSFSLFPLFSLFSLLENPSPHNFLRKDTMFVSSLRNGKRENVPRERNEDRQVVVLVSRVTMARVVFYHQAHIAV